MNRTPAPKPPYSGILPVEKLTSIINGHEVNFFGLLSTKSSDYEPGDVYRGKWDEIPEVLFKALELDTIKPLREYVLIYKPKGEYHKTFKKTKRWKK